MNTQKPIIILGMHRSGTSLLTRLLEQWGVFLGAEKEQNHESVFFLKINEWMFYQANASWDNPENMNFIDDELSKLLAQGAQFLLSSDNASQYLGQENIQKQKNFSNLDMPWGWKDPRSIFTLSIWKKIFPEARFIHIYRNPLDVANSIRSREKKRFIEIKNFVSSSGVSQIMQQGQKFRTTARCLDIHQGINLWKCYVQKAIDMTSNADSQCLSIQYEELLRNPLEISRSIVEFAGLPENNALLQKTLTGINPDRSFAFLESDELVSIYNEIRSDKLIQDLGYGDIR